MSPSNIDPATLDQGVLTQNIWGVGKNGNPSEIVKQEADTEELNYEPVRPHQTVTLSVRYAVRGRGRPLPYSLDEGDGE